ncbi:TPR domain-containing protein [Fusarium austroafricanum]|uniref:TPR domain-containing protein n=1 Tax=Fusarium austroafricanum TaxID=2364996 RepID=A0A8H4KW38_9HYPO|nr:TPR domain-containing protein [Fusarium austroafricanum]
MDDLQESIQFGRQVIDKIPPGHPNLAELFNNLAVRLGFRYSRNGAAEDLAESILLGRNAIENTSVDDPRRAAYLNNLANRLGDEYTRTNDEGFLRQGIEYAEQAVKGTLENHPDRAAWLNDLGILLSKRFSSTGTMDDLEKAIEIGRRAVSATLPNHPDYAARLNTLGSLLGDRYSRAGVEADLKDAIEIGRKALTVTPDDHPDRAAFLNDLSLRLGLQYSRTGAINILEEAIDHGKQAVYVTPPDHPEQSGRIGNLGIHLGNKYLHTGVMDDLQEAIGYHRQALGATPLNHSRRSACLNNLALHLKYRYLRTQLLGDLEESIELGQEAVDVTPPQHPDRVRRLDNLGDSLGRRYTRRGLINDLEKAIQIEREVVKVLPEDHPGQPICLNNLGIRLCQRFSKTNDTCDLEEAIQIVRWVVSNTSQVRPDQAAWLNNLGSWLRDSFLKTGVMAELEQSIYYARQAVDATPESHTDRAGRLTNLGVVLGTKYFTTLAEEHLDESLTCLDQALSQVLSPVLSRVRAGILYVHYLTVKSAWHRAYENARTVVNLIPLLSPQSLRNSDKQYVLGQIAGFASDAAAVALQAGQRPLCALDLLEQGRGILAASIEEMRTDIGDLREKHPVLATDFIRLQDEFGRPTTPKRDNELKRSPITPSDDLYHAAEELVKLLVTIRQEPGFERFLLSPSEEEMRNAAVYGPVIVINTSRYRCDALLIEQDQIRSVALPSLDYYTIESRARSGNLEGSQALAWLWDRAAEPILSALRVTDPPADDNWPHVWWIPTGPLTRFPLHAAGYHGGGSTETVLDRVVSSYSPSVKAIIHARQRPFGVSSSARALVVAMDSTPECIALPFALKELKVLREVFKSMAINAIEPGRRVSEVMVQMLRCDIFHFAGHGHTDRQDPSKSNLILEDGKLMVANLLEQNLRRTSPFLAYLSACGTGRVHNERFFDENLHLISAFQLAGFRHVIGTLWEVNDRLCVDVARITYEEIRDGGMTDESVCLGLHKAIRELRRRLSTVQTNRTSKESPCSNEGSMEARSGGKKDSSDGKMSRDILVCNDDEETHLSHWVPYVHFGV